MLAVGGGLLNDEIKLVGCEVITFPVYSCWILSVLQKENFPFLY